MTFLEKVQQFVYELSTNDKYSEFDPRKSFNRVNKPTSGDSNADSQNLLTSENAPHPQQSNNEGVYEARLAWRHIKNWLGKYSPDMLNSLQDKCTNSDLEEFQKDLNIRLPRAVSEFYKLTDGQSNFGSNNLNAGGDYGLMFGLKLMSLDEIMIMTENWRKIASVFNSEISQIKQSVNYHELAKLPTSHAISSSSTNSYKSEGRTSLSSTSSTSSSETLSHFHIPKQRSIPPGAIHETFAHPMWIPIITDEVGNYIGIDLSPPPQGRGVYGQVILFGREFDFKFKVADNWGDFLLIFANDLEIGNWELKTNTKNNDGDLFIGNEGELVYIDKNTKLEIPYLEVLKTRALKKWISSLENSDDEAGKQLLEELNNSKISILSLNKNFTSVDSFINNNLSVIDSQQQQQHTRGSSLAPPQPRKTSGSKKSPLSQEITLDEENSDDTLQEIDISK
ncbi:uncharacterized protein SPAPADRAFT_72238 [Spathaspora passalidarum NRRL Y-27907]|uniref:Knr4/Smi1-like domain-containing protein n=1 Tax=Spathaspora passalidarum (strain NRRL Y-27907 / 11-Y1) TaxID=619300 RepID=G3AQ80_SPAPN|nr:uncharacterized protein SPAPADRAFT_72238 [Spathaspora passalidarum NRRL Y-27907]EGW31426.1 hypothetical protein SPAPADRAFT_72238 [Spathaspora passalidarum NRRL Y-27907]